MNGEVTIRDLQFDDGDEDDLINDPDYEPQPFELDASSDVSMLSAAQTTTTTTDFSLRTVPSDAQSTADLSDIFPDDSISQRDARIAPQTRKYEIPPSEASETPSIISFHSSADGLLYKTLHGRAFNQSDHYMLPADDDEHWRLDMQHLALRLHLNSLYPSKHLVEHALREGQDPPPAVLDVGTGSGRWAIDLALQFPHVDVVGLDLVPPANVTEDAVPPNCRFEVDDANLPLEHYENCFNVVHMRSSEPGINDCEGFLYEVARTLRPSGILILVTGYPQIYDIDAKPFPVVEEGEPGFCWLQHNFHACYEAYKNRNNEAVDASLYWQSWLEKNPNYRSSVTRDIYIPLGPFRDGMSEREVFVSNLMREDIARIMYAFKPLLVGDGNKEEVVDQWIEGSVAELKDLKISGHIKWRYTVAIRTNRPWQERMEKPDSLDQPKQRLVLTKAPKGSVVSGCSTDITARTSSTGGAPAVTAWSLGVPPGPPDLPADLK